ncbi:MAG: zinc-binding dehydrogenase [Sandaracinus sp.]|nr:zinc-binding dehydrogenase [Sandaracinus sp.]|tara:strand:- start:1893 stop:2876 length:984 start_codon:yes stop_codon:yes gene_type:complete
MSDVYRMQVSELGGPAALEARPFEPGEPGPHEVRLRTEAIGCNFFDLLITRGKYQLKPELPFAPGGEAAGVVEAVGAEVEHVAVGDRALALVPFGAYATHLVAPAERVFRLPAETPFEVAAAMGVVYQTSYVGLVTRGRLRAGETVLVHAAAGGVGLAAVQIAKALGATVIGTAGSEPKLQLVRDEGADHAFSYRDDSWMPKVRELTGGRGVDVVYDPVGGDAFDLSTKILAWEARLLVVGFASGRIPEMAANRIMLKNVDIVGVHWGPYFEHRPQVCRDAQDALNELWRAGAVRPLVSETHPLRDAPAALARLQARQTIGKLVLTP